MTDHQERWGESTCWWCGKKPKDRIILTGPGCAICSDCVELLVVVIQQERAKQTTERQLQHEPFTVVNVVRRILAQMEISEILCIAYDAVLETDKLPLSAYGAAIERAREVWPEAEGFARAPGGWTFRIGAGYGWMTDTGHVSADPEGSRSHARSALGAAGVCQDTCQHAIISAPEDGGPGFMVNLTVTDQELDDAGRHLFGTREDREL
jgi:hypothetical protein